MTKPASSRIGIFAGTFDPIHTGHIRYALQAVRAARLSSVVFLPERHPRNKYNVISYEHRLAMVRLAVKEHERLDVLDLPDDNFTVLRTLPELQARYPGAQLVLLVGSDVAEYLPKWPDAKHLLEACELVVGVRSSHEHKEVADTIAGWPVPPQALHVLESAEPYTSSSQVRKTLRDSRTKGDGLIPAVTAYATKNALYRLHRF